MIASHAPTFSSYLVASRPAPIDRSLLDRLRVAARACRAGARVDASCTCTTPGAGMAPCLRALAAIAPQATGRHPTFYRPGEPEVSFDESLLLALVEAATRGDGDSLRFLVLRHIVQPSRVRVIFLVHRIAEARASDPEGDVEECENSVRDDVATS